MAYGDEERQEAAVRALTLREHGPAVSEWLFALELFAFAFAPDREFNTGAVPDTDPRGDDPRKEEARPAMEEWVSSRRQERARRAGHGGHRA